MDEIRILPDPYTLYTEFDDQVVEMDESLEWIVRHVPLLKLKSELGPVYSTHLRSATDTVSKGETLFNEIQDVFGIHVSPFQMFATKSDGKQAIYLASKKIEGERIIEGEWFSKQHAPLVADLYRKLYAYLENKFLEAQRTHRSMYLWDIMWPHQYALTSHEGKQVLMLVEHEPLYSATRSILYATATVMHDDIDHLCMRYGRRDGGLSEVFEKIGKLVSKIEGSEFFVRS